MRYRFIARNQEGGQKTGFLEAADEPAARQQLIRRGLQVVRLEVDRSEQPPTIPTPVAAAPLPPAAAPRPAAPKEPSLLSQLDWRKLGGGLALLSLLLSAALLAWKRAGGEKDYRIHLSGHLALVSKKELGDDYLDRVQLGLRLTEPAWQIDRDGSIEERGEDGKFHRGQRHARVQFQMGVEGDYTLDVQTSLPKAPSQASFFVEAPGFPAKQKEVKFDQGKDPQQLEAKVRPMTIRRLKKRETRATAPLERTPASDKPRFDPEAPEPDE